ncbi:indoleamine 2,3-dioxygenase [Acidimicrobiaceae bacterium]|nr:indoleamine 2,3-dioxygenase [Acidimicrobiaceae bacterium]
MGVDKLNFSILESGFLPNKISTLLSNEFDDVEHIAKNLPKILANNQIEYEVLNLETEKNVSNLSIDELERAMLLYSYIGHGYIWGGTSIEKVIPKNISKTWYKISQKLDRPPILSYASYALNNWKLQDVNKPFDLENIRILQNFLGGMDEDWFIMIHIAIEHEAKEILNNLKTYYLDKSEDQSYLENALVSIKKINQIMNRMPEKCDPFIYYNRVRPYIFGWKNNPATPNGVIYEGIEEYGGTPQLFRGETGAQSSIVPALDALLGVTHSNDPLKEYLDEMRLYMPKEHRNLLNDLDQWSKNNRSNSTTEDSSVVLSDEIINEVHAFRNKHLEYARIYIHEQSLSNQNNSNVVGTGGTPFMKYLDKHLQETVPSND